MLYGIHGQTIEEVLIEFSKEFPHLEIVGKIIVTDDDVVICDTVVNNSSEHFGRIYRDFGIGLLT
jgi:hypothetical protein